MIAIYLQFLLLFALSLLYMIIIYYISNLLYSREKLQAHQTGLLNTYKDILKNANNQEYVSAKTKELLMHGREVVVAEILFLALIPIYLVFYYLLLPYIFSFITNPINFKGYFIFFIIGAGFLFSLIKYLLTKIHAFKRIGVPKNARQDTETAPIRQ